MSEIIVCYTNGKKTWKVYAIRQNNDCELFMANLGFGFDAHASRHSDGRFHWKANGKIIGVPITGRKPFNTFTGIEVVQVSAGPVTIPDNADFFENRKEPYDKLLVIDVRNVVGVLNVTPFLIEFSTTPPDILNNFISKFNQVYIIKDQKIGFGVGITDAGKTT